MPRGREPFPRRPRMSVDGILSSPPARPSASVNSPAVGPQPQPRPAVSSSRPGNFSDIRSSYAARPSMNSRPVQPQPVQPSVQPVSPSMPLQPTQSANPALSPIPPPASPTPENPSSPPAAQPLNFTPRPSRRPRFRRVLLISVPIVVVLAAAGGVAEWFHLQSVHNNPATVFQDALNASLSTTQIQADTVSPDSGTQVDYDFSSLTDPIISSQSTVNLYGANFQIEGYGSAQNTYISYAKFPAVIPASITNVAQNAWVQLRANGAIPPTVSGTLNNLADPRYQAFGPLVFANIPEAARARLVNFLLAQHVYAYRTTQVHRSTLNGAAVYVYPVTFSVSYMQIFLQSVAVSEKFSPADIQAAINAVSGLKGDMMTLYVSASTHRFVSMSLQQAGQTTTTDYSNYDNVTLLAEPETNLSWPSFAAIQLQIEQLVAAHLSASALDAERQADINQIHGYLATYYAAHSYYPIYADLNNPTWVAANMPGLDPDALRDPLGANAQLTNKPQAKTYSYQPITTDGKICSDDITVANLLCSSYTLTAILSTGKPYVVPSP
jgi:hypothetical protein